MRLELTGRNVRITPTLERRVRLDLAKITKLLDDSATAHVILSVEKHRNRAELLINWHDKSFTGVVESTDLRSSITQVIEKIERQALRQKEKFAARRREARRASRAIPPQEALAPEPRIVRTPRYAVKLMSPEDAGIALQASDHQFVVFRNADSERIAVLYKQANGSYGLIEP